MARKLRSTSESMEGFVIQPDKVEKVVFGLWTVSRVVDICGLKVELWIFEDPRFI